MLHSHVVPLRLDDQRNPARFEDFFLFAGYPSEFAVEPPVHAPKLGAAFQILYGFQSDLAMALKLVMVASNTWCRLNGYEKLPRVIEGVKSERRLPGPTKPKPASPPDHVVTHSRP